ncbi:hypothetical protein XENOCAPTIV_010733, partial [Xenoophorus captivus]
MSVRQFGVSLGSITIRQQTSRRGYTGFIPSLQEVYVCKRRILHLSISVEAVFRCE